MACNKRPFVYITRSETFSACHRLHSTKLTDQQNIELFGKCNNKNGHGHNYKVEVTVASTVDEDTGMVMNLVALKGKIEEVLSELDHKNLDLDVEYFQTVVSTAENIAVYIYNQLNRGLPDGILYEVRVHETDKNVAFYRGQIKETLN
ncbi:predicted protein [Nematostella vectensis]|uniref:6-pyruvoyl tetrahydrobiopterin synthase n=1 Tax=Nematostella vectensis TaxID=45351 RepID=A7S0L6_NEMVE|nr:predicted protein [Nematostella vectensis]|eukprot:XP_001634822.1 predicted protein [Nematostella vectensis]